MYAPREPTTCCTKSCGIADSYRVGAERAQSHHAEVVVAKDDRLRGSPAEIGELAHRDEIDLGRERRAPPKAIPMRPVSNGRLFVESVCRPGPNMSSDLPSRKKTAAWPSRTISCDPNLNSPAPCWGTRKTISSERSFGCWMTSMMGHAALSPTRRPVRRERATGTRY